MSFCPRVWPKKHIMNDEGYINKTRPFRQFLAEGAGGAKNEDITHFFCSLAWYSLPKSEGRTIAAGPGPWNSAAMGPRRLVGVQLPL